jgi:D-sedoheptulose 7-phosphate isomerase
MSYFADLQSALATLDEMPLDDLYRLVVETKRRNGTLWLAGNGGSMATALHWATDLSKRGGIRTQVLGANQALLTAWANDTDYRAALRNELRQCIHPYDSLIVISCSGRSPNIVMLMREMWLNKQPYMLLTGSQPPFPTPLRYIIQVDSTNYGIIEDCHLAIGHWLTERLVSEQQNYG